jgi:hypothetical protein
MLKVDSLIPLAWVGWLDIEKVDSLILLASFPLLFTRESTSGSHAQS